MATVTKEEDGKNDLERFCERYPNAGEAREVTEGKLKFLNKGRKIQAGPNKGNLAADGKGPTVLFALTKPTGSKPQGEIVFTIPRRA